MSNRIFLPRGTLGQGLPSDMYVRELCWAEQTRQLWIKSFEGTAYPVGGPFSQYFSVVNEDYTASPSEQIVAIPGDGGYVISLPEGNPIGCPLFISVAPAGSGFVRVSSSQLINGLSDSADLYPGESAIFVWSATGWMYWMNGQQRLARFVNADHSIQSGDRTIFYLIDQSTNPTITLPGVPSNPLPWVTHLYWFNTLRGGGMATISPQGMPINGVVRDISIPSEREVRMVWVGGGTGWVTDSVYTNSAIGKPVIERTFRADTPWAEGGLESPPNLSAITDGNPGTSTGQGRTLDNLANPTWYLDFGSPQAFTRMRLTGVVSEWFRHDDSGTAELILWVSDSVAGPFNDTIVSLTFEEGVPLTIDAEKVGVLEGRFFGFSIFHSDRWPLAFDFQEFEVL